MGNRKHRVVFFGNHDVGVKALGALIERCDVVGVVAHPKDAEDGVRYASVFDYSNRQNLDAVRGKGKDQLVRDFVESKMPDLIWVSDFRYILPDSVLSFSKFGGVNIHPSKLPDYRGRAPLNWAIINGEKELGITAHKMDLDVDTGNILHQVVFELKESEDISDALTRCYELYPEIVHKVLDLLDNNDFDGEQQVVRGEVYPARRKEDGVIDWNSSQVQVRNLVRAVAHPYPGAFSTDQAGQNVIIQKCRIYEGLLPEFEDSENGSLISLDGKPAVKCQDGWLILEEYETDGDLLVDGNRFRLDNVYRMKNEDKEKNIEFYSQKVDKYGDDVRSLNWGSRESQEKRFLIFSKIGSLDNVSILDVGCGIGHFYTWLKINYTEFQYLGVDITPAMIDVAGKREPSAEFKVLDLLDKSQPMAEYDYVFASGIFVYHEDQPFNFMKAMVARMFELSKKGIAFNSLSSRADSKDAGEYYADPDEVLNFCKTLSANVAINHDYHPGDFTIYIRKS